MKKGKSKIVNRMNFIFFFFLLFSAFLISKIFYIQNFEFEGSNISLETIKNIEVEGVSGGNLVKVVLTGDYELKSIYLSEEAKKENHLQGVSMKLRM